MAQRDVIWKEVIRPPLWLLAFIYFMFLSLVLAVWAAFDNQIALITWIGVTLLLLSVALSAKKVITIDREELRVGKAHIELKYLDTVTLLTPAEIRALRTRDADPAAFPALIFWISNGVKITLKDPRDSTPYWLVSCKKSEEFTNTLCKLL